MSAIDVAAGAIFIICWLIYEPMVARNVGGRGAIKVDMLAVREGWVRRMLARDNRIADSNLLGQQLNSASFFASTNLLLIAAAAGLLFGGQDMLQHVRNLAITSPAPDWLMEVKIALVVAILAKGFLDFVWAIRQFNFALGLFGAAPEAGDTEHHEPYVHAVTHVLNPAYASFNSGVRTYYFALAAAAWIASPWAMLAGVLAAFLLLLRRQTSSEAALAIREARRVLEAMQRKPD